MSALCAALACGQAEALIQVKVHADFLASGFADGPVYGASGPVSFDVVFVVDETAAVHYAAGHEVAHNPTEPFTMVLDHDVYAIDRGAIHSGSSFSFGSQVVSGGDLHTLSFALLQNGTLAAPMFLSDITPGSAPHIEVIAAPSVALGGYDFGPFVPGQPRTVFLTNQAQVWDGQHSAFGTVQVSITAVPEPTGAALLAAGLLTLMLRRRGRRHGA